MIHEQSNCGGLRPSLRLTIKIAATTALVLGLAGSAMARPDSRRMSCQQVKSLIHSKGAVVITTGRYTYERYVVHDNYCASFENTRFVYIPTRDKRDCRVKKCEDASIYNDR